MYALSTYCTYNLCFGLYDTRPISIRFATCIQIPCANVYHDWACEAYQVIFAKEQSGGVVVMKM